MKIWVIGRSYPKTENNMTGSFELEQAKMLQKNGENVSYLCCSMHPKKKINSWGYERWNDDGITIYSYSKRFFPRVYPFYFSKSRNRIWRKLLKKIEEDNGRPDIIHVHYPAMLMIADALLPYHEKGVKIVVTEHWSKVLSQSLDSCETREYQKYFHFIDSCICVGSPLASSVKKYMGESSIPVNIVPNVVNQEFHPVYEMHEGFEFIAVGRLVKAKQFDQIIQAFAETLRCDSVKLTIIGGGEEAHNLRNLIKSLNIETQITLTGSLSRKQVADRIARADCLVCYSRFETFGVPLIEAWACGLPVIYTTSAAVIDNFDARLGVEVPYDDIESLKVKMRYIYDNIDSYDKVFISQFAQKRFSERAIYEKLREIYTVI